MTPRLIHSLMRRLCYFGVSEADGYRRLVDKGTLDRDLVDKLLHDYIVTGDVIVYAGAKDCSYVPIGDAFELIEKYRLRDARTTVQIVASDFSGRVVIQPIGVGVGERCIHRVE